MNREVTNGSGRKVVRILRKRGDASLCFNYRRKLWILENKGLKAQLRCDAKDTLKLVNLTNKLTGTEWISRDKPVYGFCLEINGKLHPAGNSKDKFFYHSFKHKLHKDGAIELEIILDSSVLKTKIHLHYKYYSNSTVMETWPAIENYGDSPHNLTRLDSFCLSVSPTEKDLVLYSLRGGKFDSIFPPDSFTLKETPVFENKTGRSAPGSVSNWFGVTLCCGEEGASSASEIEGRSSAKDVPWFALKDLEHNELLFGGLEWSGLWKMFFQKRAKYTKLLGGIFKFSHELQPGENLIFPKAFLGFSKGELDELWKTQHQWMEQHLCPSAPDNFPWVQYNSWYSFGHKLDEASLVKELEVAVDLGIEVFVIDAGWYKGCNGEHFGFGLGEWLPDERKFPGGLDKFANYVHKKGLKFGIWMEPERVYLESPIAKEHPEWLITREGRILKQGTGEREDWGHLCLACSDVQKWIKNEISRTIEMYRVDWLKWDYNIGYGEGCDAKDHGHQRGDGSYQYTLGLYGILDFLRVKYPGLIIENCASGGNRIDYGIIKRVHTQWLSDFTHYAASVRYHLCGAWFSLPARYLNTFISFHSDSNAEFRSRMGGALGISAMISDWPTEVRTRAKKRIEEYKQIRPLISKQRYLLLPQSRSMWEWDIWQYYDAARGTGIILYFRGKSNIQKKTVSPKGLDYAYDYEITFLDSQNKFTVSGKELKERGLTLSLSELEDSGIIYLKQRL